MHDARGISIKHGKLGNCLLLLDRPEEALAQYEKSLLNARKLPYNQLMAYLGQIKCYMTLNNPKEIEAILNQILSELESLNTISGFWIKSLEDILSDLTAGNYSMSMEKTAKELKLFLKRKKGNGN